MNFRYLVLVMIFCLQQGCAVISNIASYTVTETDIKTALLEQVDKFTLKSRIVGIPVTFAVDTLNVDIGPENRSVVVMKVSATATISAFGFSYPAKINLGIEGEPYIDQTQKAIFVRSLSLTDSQNDAGGFKGNLASLANKYLVFFDQYLTEYPVYRIDTSNIGSAWLLQGQIKMNIKPGKIVFTP